MIICDTHCDTLNVRALHKDETPCVTMENMVNGGVSLQTCALFAGSKGMSDHPYDKAMAEYEDMAATYAYSTLARLMGHQPSAEEVRETITAGENILARMRETTDNDRRRDAGEDMWIGYGYDFREVGVREQDFKNTR